MTKKYTLCHSNLNFRLMEKQKPTDSPKCRKALSFEKYNIIVRKT